MGREAMERRIAPTASVPAAVITYGHKYHQREIADLLR